MPAHASPDRAARVRRAVAARTVFSWTTIPHFSLRSEVDVTEALERGKPMAVLCAAIAAALADHPQCNVEWNDGRIRRRSSVDLGILVDTPVGLLLPVVANADGFEVGELAEAIGRAAARARAGRSSREDAAPRSVTVSNLGMFSVDSFTGIIPAPDILLMTAGRVRTAARWMGEGWQARRVVDVTLSVDHRALDGADAARLLTAIEARLTHGGRLT